MSKYMRADTLKARINPVQVYMNSLDGSLGKHLGKGWYRWNGLCPFHNDKTPGTFDINLENGRFRCHSCKIYGDIIDFQMQLHNQDFSDAMTSLQEYLQ